MSMVRNNLKRFLLPLLLLTAGHAAAQSAPPARSVTLKSIKYNGSGCPIGTVAENISADNQAFTLTFSEFIAEAGPNVSPRSNRKNCQLTAVLSIPPGWQYTVGSFNYRGFIDVDPGVTATHTTSYYFQGQGQTGTFQSRQNGPYADAFTYTDTIGLNSQNLWSPCNIERALNINAAIYVGVNDPRNTSSTGYIANDSIDGELRQRYSYSLYWRPCRS